MEAVNREQLFRRDDGAAMQCPACLATFGGMLTCPWDGSTLIPLTDSDPNAVAFYNRINEDEGC